MSENNILKEYVCLYPFNNLDIRVNESRVCCWITVPLSNKLTIYDTSDPMLEAIKDSVLDGSYRYCNSSTCPLLNEIVNSNTAPILFAPKAEFVNTLQNTMSVQKVSLNFDKSCNLQCPSCRTERIENFESSSVQYITNQRKIAEFEEKFSSTVQEILISGSGDPFFSNIFRNFLINFNKEKYPELRTIYLITNCILLTKKMWLSIAARPYIRSIEVSLDAANKETYENVVRLGGTWEIVLSNITYLSVQPSLGEMLFSMVVSKHNYKEMKAFYTLVHTLTKDATCNINVIFRRIQNWGTYSDTDFCDLLVFDPMHNEYPEFLVELQSIADLPSITHDFHHLLSK